MLFVCTVVNYFYCSVWEFYHYRRELMASKLPNPAHLAIAACEHRWRQENRSAPVLLCVRNDLTRIGIHYKLNYLKRRIHNYGFGSDKFAKLVSKNKQI
jgi:hypothetical protein